MSPRKMKEQIDRAYAALSRAADASSADRFLDQAYEAALDGERRHRRMGRGSSSYSVSPQTAAKYFVVKWAWEETFEHGARKMTAEEWSDLREDCFLAAAAAVRIRNSEHWPFEANPLEGIDYMDMVKS